MTPPTAEAAPQPIPDSCEVSLKEAVKLCGRSEKTLRRKIDAGVLTGRREDLEYGGFMWMIDLRSLAELYPGTEEVDKLLEEPGSPESRLPHVDPPPVRLSTLPDEFSAEAAPPVVPIPSTQPDFFEYLLEENRSLKEEMRAMQDRTTRLERELGEQQGTSITQARVLDWFQQQQNFRPALPAPAEARAPETAPWKVGLLTGLLATGGVLAWMSATGWV